MSDEGIAGAVAVAMGWLSREDATGIYTDADGVYIPYEFNPCTDANDDLVVKDWIVGNVTGERLDMACDHLAEVFDRRRVAGGWAKWSAGYQFAMGMHYQPGDYARALLHAMAEESEVTDGEDV